MWGVGGTCGMLHLRTLECSTPKVQSVDSDCIKPRGYARKSRQSLKGDHFMST